MTNNIGIGSTGDSSTGDSSTGDSSTGNYSTGDRSTGYWSTGDSSTGYWSTGDSSTGNYSTGKYSTGDWSAGKYSTGDWSISDYSTGHFSTVDYSGFGAFDKPCTPEEWDEASKPGYMYFDLTKWVDEDHMTETEKEEHPEYKTTEGFLKVYDYKEAWQNAWDGASDEEKKQTFELPNFDAEVFKKITGIDVYAWKYPSIANEKSKPDEITVNGVRYKKIDD